MKIEQDAPSADQLQQWLADDMDAAVLGERGLPGPPEGDVEVLYDVASRLREAFEHTDMRVQFEFVGEKYIENVAFDAIREAVFEPLEGICIIGVDDVAQQHPRRGPIHPMDRIEYKLDVCFRRWLF
jgi:hypothetical protein